MNVLLQKLFEFFEWQRTVLQRKTKICFILIAISLNTNLKIQPPKQTKKNQNKQKEKKTQNKLLQFCKITLFPYLINEENYK